MRINEVFKSVQGEGRYMGTPAVFVRLSGCTRKCSFCDTQYHTKSVEVTPEILAENIRSYNLPTIVFTGGEPLLQIEEINETIGLLGIAGYQYHLETNGDLLQPNKGWDIDLGNFNYICLSPKTHKGINNMINTLREVKVPYDVKVVTNLKGINKRLLKYATMLMPLSTGKSSVDKKVARAVWNRCVDRGLFFSAWLHVLVWGFTKR